LITKGYMLVRPIQLL